MSVAKQLPRRLGVVDTGEGVWPWEGRQVGLRHIMKKTPVSKMVKYKFKYTESKDALGMTLN